MGARVRQRPGDLGEFRDRSWPPVRDDQRSRIRFGRPQVREMNVRPVDRDGELLPLVQPGFGGPPVIPVPPDVRQLPQVHPGDAVRTTYAGQLIGPAGPVQTHVQVVKVRLRDGNAERADALTGRYRHVRARYQVTTSSSVRKYAPDAGVEPPCSSRCV